MSITDQLAHRLVEAQTALNAKTAERDAAYAKADDIRRRITELEALQRDITAKRVAGTVSPEDSVEFAALAADIELLREHRAEAEAACNRFGLSSEQAQYDSARFQFENHQRKAALAALVAKAQEIDALLVRCIEAIREAGEAMHKPATGLVMPVGLANLWAPSRALHLTILRDFAPL